MAHMVETMCADGITWHTSLTNHAICDGVQTAEKMMEIAGLNWQIVQRPVFLEGNVQIPGYVANIRTKDNQPLGIVSDVYQPVQNHEAFSFIDSVIGSGEAKFNTAGCLYNKYGRPTRIWVSAKLQSTNLLGDQIDNYLVLSHSHDGLNSVKVFVTPVRVVCHNTLTMAINGVNRSWSTQHKGDIATKLQEAQRTLELYNDYQAALPAIAETMNQINLYDDELTRIMDMLFPLPTEQGRMFNNMNELRSDVLKCYNQKDDIQRFKGTAWGFYQAVTDTMEHKSVLRNTETSEFNRQFKIIEGHPVTMKAQKLLMMVKA